MIELMLLSTLVALSQPEAEPAERGNSDAWTAFYRDAARQYAVKRAGSGETVELLDRAVFDWASINDYNGAVFAWTEDGRPLVVASIFSFPVSGSKQRLAVHEFAAFADGDLVVAGSDGSPWKPPRVAAIQPVPRAQSPPERASLLKLHCRRLAKEFAAHMNRRGERWDLRLLPTPLVEYGPTGDTILGGGLFAFVGYSTDPEVLLLLEARLGPDGAAWHFLPIRFSDKSLYLTYQDKQVWESLRKGHGSDGPDTEDPLYRVLSSERLDP
jgi:hypothetical protein